MNRNSITAALFIFIMVAGLQIAWGQQQGSVAKGNANVTIYVAGNKAYECSVSQLDSIVFSEIQPNQEEQEEIVVTVNASGYAEGEHWFEKIDETNFYIDDIKYTAQNGDLVVTGYNQAFFKGEAKIISKLKYRGRLMDVVEIAYSAFKDCQVLHSLTIGNSVTSIGRSAFEGCTSLTSIIIPNSVKIIEEKVFSGCNSLATVTMGNGVTKIGSYAFRGCSGLKKVIVPDLAAWCGISFSVIYSHYFEDNEYKDSLVDSSNPLFYSNRLYCDENTEITELIIPDGVTNIGSGAFINCSALTSVSIPNSVTNIGTDTFNGCI